LEQNQTAINIPMEGNSETWLARKDPN